jgi:hypothetical protein
MGGCMDWGVFWTAVAGLAAVAALMAAVTIAIWGYRRSRRDRIDDRVSEFFADLGKRHVLYEPVAVENPEAARQSLEEIRNKAAELYGVLRNDEDKSIVKQIREASWEAAQAMRAYGRQRGAPAVSGNWFEDVLNFYRDTMRPLVGELADRQGIARADRPKIVSYRAGFPDGPTKILDIPIPEHAKPDDDRGATHVGDDNDEREPGSERSQGDGAH